VCERSRAAASQAESRFGRNANPAARLQGGEDSRFAQDIGWVHWALRFGRCGECRLTHHSTRTGAIKPRQSVNSDVISLSQLLDVHTICIYTSVMEFTWSEAKHTTNLKTHGLDFVDAAVVFESVTFTFEDSRFSYEEQRFVTLGLLAGISVSVVHTESENEIRIISFRKATNREAKIYFNEIQN